MLFKTYVVEFGRVGTSRKKWLYSKIKRSNATIVLVNRKLRMDLPTLCYNRHYLHPYAMML